MCVECSNYATGYKKLSTQHRVMTNTVDIFSKYRYMSCVNKTQGREVMYGAVAVNKSAPASCGKHASGLKASVAMPATRKPGQNMQILVRLYSLMLMPSKYNYITSK
jgi:hypothetical protein